MEITKEVSMSDSDSDLAEELRFEKLGTLNFGSLDADIAEEGLSGVLAACHATKLAPGDSILAFAKQMIQQHVRFLSHGPLNLL